MYDNEELKLTKKRVNSKLKETIVDYYVNLGLDNNSLIDVKKLYYKWVYKICGQEKEDKFFDKLWTEIADRYQDIRYGVFDYDKREF